MQLPSPLVPGTLLGRYKRFLADVELDNGQVVTAHTPNTGAMTGCAEPGYRVWLWCVPSRARKYPWNWELVEPSPGYLVGINTSRANQLVEEAIVDSVAEELGCYERSRREVRYGHEGSRIDLLLEDSTDSHAGRCYVEVKNVTLARGGVGLFPDAVTVRGRKHLRELAAVAAAGERAAVVFCVQREDVGAFAPADDIDPAYGQALREVRESGVQVLAYGASVSLARIKLSTRLAIRI